MLKQFSRDFSPSFNLIYGENGCGKTTLLNLIENFNFSSSKIQLEGIHKISFMHLHSIGITEEMTGHEILDIFCHLKNVNREQNHVYMSSVIQKCLKLKAGELSNGMRQIFKYYLHTFWNPELILLDEPLSFLDSNNRILVLEDLIQRKNKSIIMMTSQQSLDEVRDIDFRLKLSHHD